MKQSFMASIWIRCRTTIVYSRLRLTRKVSRSSSTRREVHLHLLSQQTVERRRGANQVRRLGDEWLGRWLKNLWFVVHCFPTRDCSAVRLTMFHWRRRSSQTAKLFWHLQFSFAATTPWHLTLESILPTRKFLPRFVFLWCLFQWAFFGDF